MDHGSISVNRFDHHPKRRHHLSSIVVGIPSMGYQLYRRFPHSGRKSSSGFFWSEHMLRHKKRISATILVAVLAAWTSTAVGQGTAFTYQAILYEGGVPAGPQMDGVVILYSTPTGGAPIGSEVFNDLPIPDGLINVELDFGDVFTGDPLYLEIVVNGVTLSPRTPITPTPGAMIATRAQGAEDEFRIEGLMSGTPQRVIFGRSDDCSIGIDPTSLGGLILKDPIGARICRPTPAPPGPTRLIFGPTDDCSIGIDPTLTGLVERDPVGLRLIGPGVGGTGCQLLFGPTDDCSLRVDPPGPTALMGLQLRDPKGIRLINPSPVPGPTMLRFGPTDDCSISIDPNSLGGLILKDPIGARICRPPMAPPGPTRLLFGPTDDCSIGIDPAMSGLVERDPVGLRLLGAGGNPGRLLFGPTDDCSIMVDPPGQPGSLTGLQLRDPSGVRIVNPDPLSRIRINFGNNPDNVCAISVDPPGQPGSVPGLQLRDPGGIRVMNPQAATSPTRLLFGPTDDCSIGIDPVLPGLVERDPFGFRLLGPGVGGTGCRLLFGPTDLCTIEVDPTGSLPGLLLRDPSGIRVVNPDPQLPARINFGNNPDNVCAISVDPAGPPGLTLRDPGGVRVINPSTIPGPTRLLFGPTDDCSIGIDPAMTGLVERDPVGLRLTGFGGAAGGNGGRILFGPTDLCTIAVDPGTQGMCFRDPAGWRFKGPGFMGIGIPDPVFRVELPNMANNAGRGFANAWIDASSRRWKDDIRPIPDALDKIKKLEGVYFRWKPEHGGTNDVGFIAEDVAKVLPELVSMEDDGLAAKGMCYNRVVAVAVEGIKAQQAQIKKLREDNAKLKADLAALTARVDALVGNGQGQGGHP